MDTLKALIVEKKRAIGVINNNATDGNDSRSTKKKKKQYLTVSQRRKLQQQHQQQFFDSSSDDDDDEKDKRRKRKRKRRKNKKSNTHHNDSKNNDDSSSGNGDSDNSSSGEDLTTLLTTKKYYDPSLLMQSKRQNQKKKGEEEPSQTTKKKDCHDDGDDNDEYGRPCSSVNKKQRTSTATNHYGSHNDKSDTAAAAAAKNTNNNGIIIPEELRQLTPVEVTNRLRSYGLPICLFGEKSSGINDKNSNNDDLPRLQRLYIAIQGREAAMLGASEKDDFLLDSADRTRNIFLEKEEMNVKLTSGTTSAATSAAAPTPPSSSAIKTTTPTKTKEQQHQQQKNDRELTEEELNDKPKRIYRYFKTLLRQWEEDLNIRPDSIKRTMAGKNETKTLKQCKDYIRPLFQLCKRRELDDSLQNHLFKIVLYCEQGEFVKAHDAYLDVAIGRAAWPIGVTMVGIHARSGRAKIESANVAHVMNSELQRKYLTSVKRLMSYAQRKRGDVDPSKKVVNL